MDAADLKKLYGLNHRVLAINLDGIGHEDSLVAPKPAGHCINWVLGHILDNRRHVLRLVGREPVWSEVDGERYRRGSDPLSDGGAAMRLERMVDDLNRSQELLLDGLSSMDEAAFEERTESGSVREALAFLQFHEAYHAGQIGVLRRIAGKPGGIA